MTKKEKKEKKIKTTERTLVEEIKGQSETPRVTQ